MRTLYWFGNDSAIGLRLNGCADAPFKLGVKNHNAGPIDFDDTKAAFGNSLAKT